MYDILIIGGGPAGLSAAVYALRSGKKTALLEKEALGGQISSSPLIENYPGIKAASGADFSLGLYEQVNALGLEVVFEEAIDVKKDGNIFTVLTKENMFKSKAIILALGLVHRKLGIEKEKEFTGSGVSYCAYCDGAFFKGKTVAVVGGGNSALSEAVYLSGLCSRVYLIHRRNELRGEKYFQDIIKEKENIVCVLNSEVAKILGDTKVSGIEVFNNKTNEKKEIGVDGLFVSIGHIPQNQIVENRYLNEDGYILTDRRGFFGVEGMFAAGDCTESELKQLVTAVSDGAKAATAACEYIDKINKS